MEQLIYLALVFCFGTCVGSFCGVCMYRLPKSMSITFSRSHCMSCGHSIAWYDNLPILSCLFLKARCRYCYAYYGYLHLFYEFLFGFMAVIMWLYFDSYILALYGFVLFSIVMVITDIDFRYKIIPDEVLIFGMILAFAMLALSYALNLIWPVNFYEALAGSIGGFSFLWLVSFLYSVIRGKEGLGFGDVKMMGWIGLHVGLLGVAKVLFFSSLLGVMMWGFASIVYKLKKDDAIAFGPYLGWAFLTIWLLMFA
ncbi:MAG TPA: prepilin peptidase [Oligoflexia bacterium]|nr:prepilin peptidase [Oligoflexia bacterium]HMR24145.1 prepilin peptidase [Oligoflexia bacterium]